MTIDEGSGVVSLSAQSDSDGGTYSLQVRSYLADYPNIEVLKTIEVQVYAIEYQSWTPTFHEEAAEEES